MQRAHTRGYLRACAAGQSRIPPCPAARVGVPQPGSCPSSAGVNARVNAFTRRCKQTLARIVPAGWPRCRDRRGSPPHPAPSSSHHATRTTSNPGPVRGSESGSPNRQPAPMKRRVALLALLMPLVLAGGTAAPSEGLGALAHSIRLDAVGAARVSSAVAVAWCGTGQPPAVNRKPEADYSSFRHVHVTYVIPADDAEPDGGTRLQDRDRSVGCGCLVAA